MNEMHGKPVRIDDVRRNILPLPAPEAHRQETGHGYALEVRTGKWKCDKCAAKGRV